MPHRAAITPKHAGRTGAGIAVTIEAMHPAHNPVSSFESSRAVDDPLTAAAQKALVEWRAAFDTRLEALENALQHPGPDLATVMIEFARVAGDEAEATARHASLEAHVGGRESAAADREVQEEELRALRDELTRVERTQDEMRQALEGTRRAHEETRRALEEARQALEDARQANQGVHETIDAARRAAVEAQTQARHGEEERRELMGVQAQLTSQLAQARDDADEARAQVAALREQLTEARAGADGQARELLTFRRRLEQAVREAEERSRAQAQALQDERMRFDQTVKDERARFERVANEAVARAAAAAAELARANQRLAVVSREADMMRPQIEAAHERITGLDLELQTRGRIITELQEQVKARRAERPVTPPASPAPPPSAAPAAPARDADATAPPLAALVTAPAASMPAAPPTPAVQPPPPVAASVEPAPPAWPLAAPTSPTSPAPPAPLPSPPLPAALEWMQAQQTDTVATEAESTLADSHDPGDSLFGDDEPVEGEPDGAGVFSTVADALRAWATETDGPHAAPPSKPDTGGATIASGSPQADEASSPPAGSRPRPASSEWDLVRQSVRYDLASLRIAVTIDSEPGTLVDLSTGGAQVVTSAMLKPGRQVRVTFPAAGPLATGKAKIAWSRLEPPSQGGGELQYRAGLTFTKIEQRTIDRVLSATHGDGLR